MTKASPRAPAVTSPSGETAAEVSLLVRKTASDVTSRSVPSEYLARTVSFWAAFSPSRTDFLG
jgi:hypothetical protein